VKLSGNIASLRKLDCRYLAEDEAACSAADLVLKNPSPRPTCADANAETRNVVVKNDLINDARIKF